MTILVADDHQVVRTGIKQVLAAYSDLAVVAEATDGRDALNQIHAKAFDLVLIDLAMPGISGIDLIRRIKLERPKAAILVHSMYVDGQTAARALKAGAGGYITKGSDAATLVEGVRQVAMGKKFISPDLVDDVLSSLSADNPGLPHERLSDREFQVFRMLADGQAVGAIAAALSLSPKTVSTHKVRLMQKLNIKSHTELIRYAIAHHMIS